MLFRVTAVLMYLGKNKKRPYILICCSLAYLIAASPIYIHMPSINSPLFTYVSATWKVMLWYR